MSAVAGALGWLRCLLFQVDANMPTRNPAFAAGKPSGVFLPASADRHARAPQSRGIPGPAGPELTLKPQTNSKFRPLGRSAPRVQAIRPEALTRRP